MARRVDVVRIAAGESRGTGFLIERGRVLTALHVIGRIADGELRLHGPTIELTAATVDERQTGSFRFLVSICTADDVALFDEQLDWACLSVDEVAFRGVEPIPLRALDDADQSAAWDTYGFPDGDVDDGKATTGILASTAASVRVYSVSVAALQLFSREAAAPGGGIVRGYSGGPVVVDGHAVGLLAAAAEENGRSVEGTLYGIPISSIAERLKLPPLPSRSPAQSRRRSSRAGVDWDQKVLAIARLFREGGELLDREPLRAALAAAQVIERIIDYLQERELEPPDPADTFEDKLRRLRAKEVVPRREEVHFGTVLRHMRSFVHTDTVPREPEPREIESGLASLEIVVKWFFLEYLRRPPPAPCWRPRDSRNADAPDLTPVSTTSTLLDAGTRFGTGFGEFTPVWRSKCVQSALRLGLPEEEAAQQTFRFDESKDTYFIGRGVRPDGSPNDFAFSDAFSSVSRGAAVLLVRGSDVLLRNTSGKENLYVRGELVGNETARVLRHGDTIQLGVSSTGSAIGTFYDGRYYTAAPSSAVDACTGLLSRVGLLAEVAGALATGKARILFVLRCSELLALEGSEASWEDTGKRAANAALALHHYDPSVPIACIGNDVCALLAPDASVQSYSDVGRAHLGGAGVSGFLLLRGTADQASSRLDASLGALTRLAIAGSSQGGPLDLAKHALTPVPLARFAEDAVPLCDLGGGAVLLALHDVERLRELSRQALAALELELLEMLGSRMGSRDIASFAGPGLIAFATPGDVQRFAHETSVGWHARGPVVVNAVEIDRALSTHILTQGDLKHLEQRASALAHGAIGALGLEGFPAPIALPARRVDNANNAFDRARSLVDLTTQAWKFLAFVLVAAARASGASDVPSRVTAAEMDGSSWPAPWRKLALASASRLEQQGGRMAELASAAILAEREGPLRDALALLAESATWLARGTRGEEAAWARKVPLLEQAGREVISGLRSLRGWTVIAVVGAQYVDIDSQTQRIEYVDYTGPNARGSRQQVSVVGFRGMAQFVYLVRWNERLAIALEPLVRHVRNESTGDDEIFLADSPIALPGPSRYQSMANSQEIDLPVTPKQLGVMR